MLEKGDDENMPVNKLNCIDRLRVFATFAVVMIHICMTEVENSTINNIGICNYIIYSIGYNLVRWAVPVFIMISGFLLLQPSKEISNRKLRHYIIRMALTLLIFGTIYATMEIVFDSGLEQWQLLIPKAIIRVLQMKSWDHLWYLYCLIGLYIMTPFAKAAMKSIHENQLKTLLLVLYFLDFIIPALNMMTGMRLSTFYIAANQYFFYYLLGYYLSLKDNCIIKNQKLVYVFAACSFIIMSLWDAIKVYLYSDYSHWIRKANFLIPPMAVAIFICFLVNKRFNEPEEKWLKSISRCSFGIYLIHPFYVNIFYKVLHITPTSVPIVLGIVVLFAVVFAAAWFSSWIIVKIPGINKII